MNMAIIKHLRLISEIINCVFAGAKTMDSGIV